MRATIRLGLGLCLLGTMATSTVGAQGGTIVGVQDVAWSADGRRLFFSAMRVKPDYSDYTPANWSVYVYDLSAQTVRQVVSTAFSVTATPREPQLVVGKLASGNRDLYLVDEAGRELRRLTADPAEDFGAAWSPDGRSIAFTSKRGGKSEVYIAAADGSGPRRLVDAGGDRTLNPAWSPDGSLIAYYREKGDGKDQIHVVRPDGTGDRNLTDDEFNNIYPGWTPDGRVVYGQTRKSEPANAFVVRPDGSGKEPLLGLHAFFLRYSPDGGRIAAIEEAPGGNGVRVVIMGSDGSSPISVPLDPVGGGSGGVPTAAVEAMDPRGARQGIPRREAPNRGARARCARHMLCAWPPR